MENVLFEVCLLYSEYTICTFIILMHTVTVLHDRSVSLSI